MVLGLALAVTSVRTAVSLYAYKVCLFFFFIALEPRVE